MLCRNLASEAQKESDGGGEAGRAASHSGPATQRVRFASAGGADSDDEDATQHQDKDGEPRDSDARPPPYKRRKSNFSIPAFQVRATGTPTRSGSIDISSRGPGKENIGASIAESEEYPLRSAVLKCVTASGVATFHLEFSLDLCGGQGNGDHVQGQHRNSPAKKHSSSSICSTLNGYTAEEDEFLKQLKERHELPWKEIHRQFIQAFPRKNRSVPALQVRYCTKLKGSQPGSCQ
ncbi:hypothetical protein F4805DRAFT_409550 [Annulohypoxylon moriforme]|nr:hypothetical protein F4805DRAFT_409550 [Annulohypoxylon moriforme]